LKNFDQSFCLVGPERIFALLFFAGIIQFVRTDSVKNASSRGSERLDFDIDLNDAMQARPAGIGVKLLNLRA
jgi:hypothetical protein